MIFRNTLRYLNILDKVHNVMCNRNSPILANPLKIVILVELFFVAYPAKTQILLFLCEMLFEITLELMVQKKLGRKFMWPIVEVEVWRKRVNMVDKWDQMGQDMPKYI